MFQFVGFRLQAFWVVPQWCFKICRTCRRMEAPPNGHNWQFIVLVVVWSTCHTCAFEGWRTRVTPTSWRTCSLFSSQVGGGTNLRGKHRGGREEDGNEGCERIKWWDMVVTHYESFLEGNPILESTEAIWCSTHRNLWGVKKKGKVHDNPSIEWSVLQNITQHWKAINFGWKNWLEAL